MAAPFNLNSLTLPRRAARVPPTNSVPASQLDNRTFYSISHVNGEEPTFYGRFAGHQELANGTQTARFDHLVIPNQELINESTYRTVMTEDWFFIPLPSTATNGEQSGGKKRTRVHHRKKRITRKLKNRKHHKSY